MSCSRTGDRCASAAGRNGVAGYMSRALNTMSSWQTVNQVLSGSKQWNDVPGRLGDTALGLVGLGRDRGGKLYLANVAGLILATHAIEHGTGVAATMVARNAVRGIPYGQYRGVILRRNPYLAAMQKLRRLARPLQMYRPKNWFPSELKDGFYFHQGGRTWSCLTAGYRVTKDTSKTLMSVKQLSFPGRAYYFDRRIDERDVVDVVLGDKDPDTIPGYLGGTNEIDAVVRPLGAAKKALMGLNWLTMDDTERDTRGEDFVDYGALAAPRTRPYASWSSESNNYTNHSGYGSASLGPYGRAYRYADLLKRNGPQVAMKDVPVSEGYGGLKLAEEKKPGPQDFVSDLWGNKPGQGAKGKPTAGSPTERTDDDAFKVVKAVKYTDLMATLGGKALAPPTVMLTDEGGDLGPRPLRVEALDTFKNGRTLAEAYYQDLNGQWQPIADEKALEQIAKVVMDEYTRQSRLAG